MANTEYYKNDKEFGLLKRDIETMVTITIPLDSLNEKDTAQTVRYTCVKYPELSKKYIISKGESVEIPKYIYDRVIKNSHLIKGHVKAKIKEAK